VVDGVEKGEGEREREKVNKKKYGKRERAGGR